MHLDTSWDGLERRVGLRNLAEKPGLSRACPFFAKQWRQSLAIRSGCTDDPGVPLGDLERGRSCDGTYYVQAPVSTLGVVPGAVTATGRARGIRFEPGYIDPPGSQLNNRPRPGVPEPFSNKFFHGVSYFIVFGGGLRHLGHSTMTRASPREYSSDCSCQFSQA